MPFIFKRAPVCWLALGLVACSVESGPTDTPTPTAETERIVIHDGPYGDRIMLVAADGTETEVEEGDPRLEAARGAEPEPEGYGESRAPLLAPTHTDNETVYVCAENYPNHEKITQFPFVIDSLKYSPTVGVNFRVDNGYFSGGSCRDRYDVKYQVQNIACSNCGVGQSCWFASTACKSGSGARHKQCLIDISVGCMNKYVENHYPKAQWATTKNNLYRWTALHEYGHALGLKHFSSNCGSRLDTVMSYCSPYSLFAFNSGEIADLQKAITADTEL